MTKYYLARDCYSFCSKIRRNMLTQLTEIKQELCQSFFNKIMINYS